MSLAGLELIFLRKDVIHITTVLARLAVLRVHSYVRQELFLFYSIPIVKIKQIIIFGIIIHIV